MAQRLRNASFGQAVDIESGAPKQVRWNINAVQRFVVVTEVLQVI